MSKRRDKENEDWLAKRACEISAAESVKNFDGKTATLLKKRCD